MEEHEIFLNMVEQILIHDPEDEAKQKLYTSPWIRHFITMQEFIYVFNKKPEIGDHYKGLQIGDWFSEQLPLFNKKQLSDNQYIHLARMIPIIDRKLSLWGSEFTTVYLYLLRTEFQSFGRGYVIPLQEYSIRQWIKIQQKNHRELRLLPSEIDSLESIPNWKWN